MRTEKSTSNIPMILFYVVGIVALIVCAVIALKVFAFVGKIFIVPVVALVAIGFLIYLMMKGIRNRTTI